MARMRTEPKWTPERIKALRDRYSETQEQFRHRFPISLSTLKYWETGGEPSDMACTLLDRLEEDLQEGRVRQLQAASA